MREAAQGYQKTSVKPYDFLSFRLIKVTLSAS